MPYGDPLFDPAPFDVLLSGPYNAARRPLIGPHASLEMRPRDVGAGVPAYATVGVAEDNRRALGVAARDIQN